MTLRGLHRNGPLGYQLCKAYAVASTEPEAAARCAHAVGAALPSTCDGPRFTVRADAVRRDIVWIDSGTLFLIDPQARLAARTGLAAVVRVLAEACRARNAQLVPVGWNRLTARSLVADLHLLRVLDDRHRELVTNLLRVHVPELVALTGRGVVRDSGLETVGSSRLASATDMVSTRYIASASATHIGRVRESLRRDDGVARLETMDVNPVDNGIGPPNVTVRCVDAQILPTSSLTQGLVLQALVMRAGALQRDGNRVGAVPQRLLDRNRSRAIAGGMASTFECERRHEPAEQDRTASASVVASTLLESVTAELRALSVTADELAPITAGLAVDTTVHRGIRTENEWLLDARSRGMALADTIPARMLDEQWLLADHLGSANSNVAAAATEVSSSIWASRLEATLPAAPTPETAARAPVTAPAPPDSPAAEPIDALVDDLEHGPADDRAVAAALRRYATHRPADLTGELEGLPPARATALRQVMRRGAHTVRLDVVSAASVVTALETCVSSAADGGRCLLVARAPAASWDEIGPAVHAGLGARPPGVVVVLIGQAPSTDRMGSWVHLQVLAAAEEPDGSVSSA